MSKKVKNCGVYVRKSRSQEGLTDEETLEKQRESLITFAKGKGYNIYNVYQEVASSIDAEREQLLALENDIKEGHIQVVIVQAIDRIARSVGIFEHLLDLCKVHSVLIETPNSTVDAKVQGAELLALIQSIIGKGEYAATKERLARGKVQAVNISKRWIGSSAPYGYLYDKNDKKLKLHPDESKVFRKMVELGLEGNSFGQIAEAIDNLGYRTQNNNRWTAGRVQKILKNRTYLGEAEYNSTTVGQKGYAKDCHDPLITEDEYRRIFTLSAARRNYDDSRSWGKTKTLIDGLLFCAKCHRGMSIQISKKESKVRGKWSFYQARKCIHRNKDGNKCDNHGCKIEYIENILIENLNMYIAEINDEIIKLENEDNSSVSDEIKTKIADVESSIRKQQNKIDRLMDIYLDGELEKDVYSKRKSNLIKEKEVMENELEYLEAKLKNMDTREVIKEYKIKLENINIFLDESNPIAVRNKALKTFLARIELLKESQYDKPIIDIEYL
jgi:site-specific DNA recombinase